MRHPPKYRDALAKTNRRQILDRRSPYPSSSGHFMIYAAVATFKPFPSSSTQPPPRAELQIYLSTLAWLVSVHLSWCRWVLLQGLDLLGVLLISNISVTLCLALELVGDRSLILWGLC